MDHDMKPAERVHVDLGQRSYDIRIGPDLLGTIASQLQGVLKRDRIFILSDDTVWALYGEQLRHHLRRESIRPIAKVLPAGESTKSWPSLESCLDWLLEEQATRDDVLLAFGGGVIGDLAGLTAALLKRGMRFVQMPTTLLAQVDSSVGGKTAINTRQGKNLIGAFYQPSLVLADLDLLKTLPERQIRAGYAEILKYGLINDPDFLDWLSQAGRAVLALDPDPLSHAVAVSCRSKARIVAQDEQEGGVRALLNLGHTFGHALEHMNGYGPHLLHGEAVGTGMALALNYSARLGLMPGDQAQRGCDLISAAGLQSDISKLSGGPYSAKALTAAMQQDKKVRANNLPLILAKGLGIAFIYPQADLADVEAFLHDQLNKTFPQN